MSNPKFLWEDTYMSQRTYPIQLFQNRPQNSPIGACVLYLHWHSHMELISVKKGNVLFHIDSQTIEATEGDIIFVPSGCLHVAYSRTTDRVELDCIVFNVSLFHEWFNDPFHIALLEDYFQGNINFPLILSKENSHYPILNDELKGILIELERKDNGYILIVKAKLYAWFVTWARLNLPSKQNRQMHDILFVHRERFKQLLNWIKQNYHMKPTVAQAARIVGLDPYYFCKLFKKMTGRTFIEYVNVYRVTEAERMLKASDASLSEIAHQIGCENGAYFTRLYKQYRGMTPSLARKQLKI